MKVVNVSREVKNGHGTWFEITYKQKGKNKKGWIKSSYLADYKKAKKVTKKMFVKNNTAILYKNPTIKNSKKVGKTSSMKNKVVTITSQTETPYGSMYKVSYKQKKATKSGWLKASELTEYINKKSMNQKMVIKSKKAVLYNKAYLPGAKKSGNTSKLNNKNVVVKERRTTAYGTYYQFVYNKKKVWIKSTYCAEVKAFTFIGNKSTKVLHKSTCQHVKRMSAKNKVKFKTKKDATKLKYKSCKVCKV